MPVVAAARGAVLVVTTIEDVDLAELSYPSPDAVGVRLRL
jgi:hypothetical protein